MTFGKMEDLVDVWYSQLKYSNFNPEISLDIEPTFELTHYTITMRYKGKVIKNSITDHSLFHMQEENFINILNKMWDEINKSLSTSVSVNNKVYSASLFDLERRKEMGFKKLNELIDNWWKNTGSHYLHPMPAIEVNMSTTNKGCIEISMANGSRKVTKMLSPYYHPLEKEIIYSTLDNMWEEFNKSISTSVRVHYPKDYDICDCILPVTKYIEHDIESCCNFFNIVFVNNLIKKVIFSDPCTIVLWKDGTKTIVRCTDEKFDKEKGLAMCIAKKSLGNKGKYYDVFKKWIEEEEK